MPRPVDRRMRYEPALDGIRAFAVIAVIAYHLDLPIVPGGLLGVGVFFTLSGFLITSILLDSWARTGGLELRTFWIRRARRLFPALLVMLVVVLAATLLVASDVFGQRLGEAAAAALYVSNWATIASDVSYFDRFGGYGPFDHLWSLAIEEQFYVLWPLVLLVFLKVARGRLGWVLLATLGLAAVSFLLLAGFAEPGFDNTRAYEGTDTRAGGLLIGAALAIAVRQASQASGSLRTVWLARALRPWADVAGLVALLAIVGLMLATDDYSASLYTWGLLALSIFTAVLVLVAIEPTSRIIRPALSIAPMRWLGERSYGIYLWHLPVIAFTPASLLADSPVGRAAFQIGLTLVIAALSWTLVEDPIRRGGARPQRPAPPGAANTVGSERDSATVVPSRAKPASMLSVTAGTAALMVLATAALSASTLETSAANTDSSAISFSTNDQSALGAPLPEAPPPPPASTPTPTPKPATTAPAPPPATTPTPQPAAPRPTARSASQTSCASVVHVGDSTSVGLTSTSYLPKASDRIDAQYRAVGVRDASTDINGARSIVEKFKGQPNAQEAVASKMAKGYNGCWVIAMGTNDAANQAVGSRIGDDDRIDRIMREIGTQPAMWLTVKTLRGSGPYKNQQMQQWNESLVKACERYPNMRVYDWSSQVKDGWYISDGIHFTSEGYRNRSALTAKALATAFPADQAAASSCLVTPR